jgi:hypothetical protein
MNPEYVRYLAAEAQWQEARWQVHGVYAEWMAATLGEDSDHVSREHRIGERLQEREERMDCGQKDAMP